MLKSGAAFTNCKLHKLKPVFKSFVHNVKNHVISFQQFRPTFFNDFQRLLSLTATY